MEEGVPTSPVRRFTCPGLLLLTHPLVTLSLSA